MKKMKKPFLRRKILQQRNLLQRKLLPKPPLRIKARMVKKRKKAKIKKMLLKSQERKRKKLAQASLWVVVVQEVVDNLNKKFHSLKKKLRHTSLNSSKKIIDHMVIKIF